MPIYEYKCKVCKARFEQYVRSMGTETRVICPSCGAEEVTRELSIFGVGRGSGAGSQVDSAAASCSPAST